MDSASDLNRVGSERDGASDPGADAVQWAEMDADVAAMLEVAEGSEAAFRGIVDRWKRPLISFFARSLHSLPAAEDLAQETFIRLYRAAPNYRAQARFPAYLFQIARRLLLNELRRQKRKPAAPVEPMLFETTEAEPDGTDLTRELQQAFTNALSSLPENQKNALLLYVQQDLSYDEIAQAMEVSLAAVKTWIYRARQQLKTDLADYLPPQ